MPLRALSLIIALSGLCLAPSVAHAAPPANDSFASPVVLTGTTATHSGNNSEASVALQSGEPNHAEWTDGIAARSVWFRWQAPVGVGETSVSLCDSANTADSVLAIYTGSAVNALTLAPGARNDDGCGSVFGPSEVTFTPVAGTTYRIVVADWDADDGAINGPYELDLFPAPGIPANDAFANAEALTGTTDTVVSNNIRATMETGEPNHSSAFGGSARRSVWFKWQAPSAGDATVSLCDSGETDDSVLAVYTGAAVNALTLPAVTSDDDGCEYDEGPSTVTWDATAGTTYRIAVANWDSDLGIGNGYELEFTFESDVTDLPPDTQVTAFAPFTRSTTFGTSGFQTLVTQALSISFSSSAADLGHFECLVDGTVVDNTCDSPYTDSNPPGGSHTFAVRAVDAAGNPDPSPATQNFTVDKTVPPVSITGGPANGSTTSDSTPAITVNAEAGATLVCRVDAGNYYLCLGATFDAPELSDGQHTVAVWGVDAAGNVGGPASRTFTVAKPPDSQVTGFSPFTRATTFGSGGFETSVTQALSISFSSSASDLGHFECLVDGSVVDNRCESPYLDSNPPGGSHTFAVRAVDAAGNPDPSPATQDFSVDKANPSVDITGGPANGSTTVDTTPAITIAAEAGATLVCRLDAGAYEACSGASFDLPELSEAEHTLEVYAIDAAGNVGGPASRTFTVVSGSVQDCLDAQAQLADAQAGVTATEAKVGRAEDRLQKAKKSGKRKKIRRAKSKVKAAKKLKAQAAAAVATAELAVAEHCG